jgi:hypothetical protein
MSYRGKGRVLAVALVGALAGLTVTAPATRAEAAGATDCSGWGGVLNNAVGLGTGGLQAAILAEPDLGTPYVDGNVVRADGSVSFMSYGSCSSQIAFQMQTKACGAFGCSWETRNHGTWEFLWQHDDTGTLSQDVAMTCRAGTNSYRIHMAVTNVVSEVEGNGDGEGTIGAALEPEQEDGPVVKLTC